MPGYCWSGSWFVMPIVGLFLVGLVLAALFGRAAPSGRARWFQGRGRKVERPLDILKRRYAKGEITRDQFDEMCRDLASASERA